MTTQHPAPADFDPAFKTAAGRRGPDCVTGDGKDVFLVEARQLGPHLKEAVVTEGEGGAVWRVASDEGLHLHGTDLAPFPLGFFNAGLQSDLQQRIVTAAARRHVSISSLSLELATEYSLSGSFISGTGRGFAEGVEVSVGLETSASEAEAEAVIREALEASPAFALLRHEIRNAFSLVCNGRRRDPSQLKASTASTPQDPFLKYSKAPVRLSEAGIVAAPIVRTADKTPDDAEVANSAKNAAGRVTWKVKGSGRRDLSSGLYHSRVALNRAGNTVFAFTTDETGAGRAPTGLTHLSAAIAFCYMTQLSRYIDGMKLPVQAVRLVQTSPWAVTAGRGEASGVDTHLFMQGEADDETFETLQRIAAETCYLHRSMETDTPVVLGITRNEGGERRLAV